MVQGSMVQGSMVQGSKAQKAGHWACRSAMLRVHTSTGSVFRLPIRLFKCSIVHLFNCSNAARSRVQCWAFKGSMLRVQGSRFNAARSRLQCFAFKVQGSMLRVQGSRFNAARSRVQCFAFKVQGL